MSSASQRASSLLRGLLTRATRAPFSSTASSASSVVLGCSAGAVDNAVVARAAVAGPVMMRRCYSSWEGAWASPRQHMHSDVAMARSMLPHRTNFVPQFYAHGFMLVPESLLSPLTLQQQHEVAAAAAAFHQQQQRWRGADGAGLAEGGALYADSVKRKRRLKMKKHKYKKRMRALAGGKAK